MAQLEHKAKPQFSQPVRQIVMMVVALILTGVGIYLALPRVSSVFAANPYFNGVIVLVFGIGVWACFAQVLSLISAVRWIEGFTTNRLGHQMTRPPRLLVSLAALLRSRGLNNQINSTAAASILDSLATRIEERREITRYITNVLIFLGLLGTFYGLAITVPAVVDTIRQLTPQEDEAGVQVFARLMVGLESQLGGMGIAFASSLLGLAGSLIIGLLEIFAGHGQNRFYRELEEWLSTITRIGLGDGEGGAQAALVPVIERMADQMEALQEVLMQSNARRDLIDQRLDRLSESMQRLADRMESSTPSTQALLRVADGQERLVAAIAGHSQNEALDAESRMRLRSMDVQLLRILEEISAGRQESMAELRTELASLGQVLQQWRQNAGGRPQT